MTAECPYAYTAHLTTHTLDLYPHSLPSLARMHTNAHTCMTEREIRFHNSSNLHIIATLRDTCPYTHRHTHPRHTAVCWAHFILSRLNSRIPSPGPQISMRSFRLMRSRSSAEKLANRLRYWPNLLLCSHCLVSKWDVPGPISGYTGAADAQMW